METSFYEKFKNVCTLDTCRNGNYTWLVDRFDNGLYCLDETTGNIRFLESLESNAYYVPSEYSYLLFYEDKLYVFPQNSWSVIIYNISSREIQKILLSCQQYDFGYGVSNAFILDEYIYAFSCFDIFTPVRISLKTGDVSCLAGWEKFLDFPFTKSRYFLEDIAHINDKLYFSPYGNESIWCYSIASKEFSKEFQLKQGFRTRHISIDSSNTIWITSAQKNGGIARIDLQSKEVKYYVVPQKFATTTVRLCVSDNCVFFIPREGDCILQYNWEDDCIEELAYDKGVLPKTVAMEERIFFSCYYEKQTLYVYFYQHGGRIKIYLITGESRYEPLDKNPKMNVREILKANFWAYHDVKSISHAQYVHEGNLPLELFLDILTSTECRDVAYLHNAEDYNVGREIIRKCVSVHRRKCLNGGNYEQN